MKRKQPAEPRGTPMGDWLIHMMRMQGCDPADIQKAEERLKGPKRAVDRLLEDEPLV